MLVYPVRQTIKKRLHSIIPKIILQANILDYITTKLIQNNESREWLMHRLAIYEIKEGADFDHTPLDQLSEIQGFEDCFWLFSSNDLNLSLSQLRLDDAAYLYHLLSDCNQPRIAELGRYKGGTTFLLAAAGAEVLSLENDPSVQERYLSSLNHALDRFGLTDRVNALFDDAYSYESEEHSFDFILVHCSPPSYEHTRDLVKHWWPFLCVGGYMILHDTPFLPGEQKFIKEMRNSFETWPAEFERNTPGENVYFKKVGEIV